MINNCPKCGSPCNTGGACQCPQLTATDGAWLFIQFEDPEIFRLRSALSRTKSNLELCEKSLRAYAEKVDRLQSDLDDCRESLLDAQANVYRLQTETENAAEWRDFDVSIACEREETIKKLKADIAQEKGKTLRLMSAEWSAICERDEARKWAVALYKAAKFWGALWNHTSGGIDEG